MADFATIKADIQAAGNLIQSIAGSVDPALIPFIVIGKGIASAVPDLVGDVEDWVAKAKSGMPVSDQENQALAGKIAGCLHPELL